MSLSVNVNAALAVEWEKGSAKAVHAGGYQGWADSVFLPFFWRYTGLLQADLFTGLFEARCRTSLPTHTLIRPSQGRPEK